MRKNVCIVLTTYFFFKCYSFRVLKGFEKLRTPKSPKSPKSPKRQEPKLKNLYDLKRKTILDLGSSFKNVTHYVKSDVTIVKRNSDSDTNTRNLGPILVLPGLDMSGLSVFPNVVRAGEKRDSYVVLAGYSKNQTLEELCDCVVNFVVSNLLEDITMIGESFGGLMALSVSNIIRQKISHIILLNPATSYHKTSWHKIVNKMGKYRTINLDNINSRLLEHGPSIKHVIESIYHMSETHPDHVYFYIVSYFMMLFNIIVTDETLVKQRINSYLSVSQYEIDSLCKYVKTPTTIIVGEKDSMLPSVKEAGVLNKIIELSTVIKVKEAGHLFCASDFDIRDLL